MSTISRLSISALQAGLSRVAEPDPVRRLPRPVRVCRAHLMEFEISLQYGDGDGGLKIRVRPRWARRVTGQIPAMLHWLEGAFMFFSFDGIDGVGKSTQMELFCQWLQELGFSPVTCRDPGSTRLGEALRQLVLDPKSPPIGRRSETLLYMAARAQLVEEIIHPTLERGGIVVSDRFLLANVVYQGHAGGLDVSTLWEVGDFAVRSCEPNLIFLLDLDVATANVRRGRSADRMEARGVEYLERVRAGFLAEAKRRPDQIVVVDAAQPMEDVQHQIREIAHPWVRAPRSVASPAGGTPPNQES